MTGKAPGILGLALVMGLAGCAPQPTTARDPTAPAGPAQRVVQQAPPSDEDAAGDASLDALIRQLDAETASATASAAMDTQALPATGYRTQQYGAFARCFRIYERCQNRSRWGGFGNFGSYRRFGANRFCRRLFRRCLAIY